MTNLELISKLETYKNLEKTEWVQLISAYTEEDRRYAANTARKITDAIYGKEIYLRALIEISNICKNDCLYCGIRRSNERAERYRMTKEEILACCEQGSIAGFKTFVLQGGEDGYFTDDVICGIISEIRRRYPDCAITVSLGERSRSSYRQMRSAGADRYLLRHETASCAHYKMLHPQSMSYENRMRCLQDLKELGFQTGCGMMIGSPFQTAEHLAEDMMFMGDFKPHMIGMGPFIPAANTPFSGEKAGSLDKTLFLLSLCRIMLPEVLLPATTALATLDAKGREKAIFAGANVVMPNISPGENRKKYLLYDNKAGISEDITKSVEKVVTMISDIGYKVSSSRGDHGGENKWSI